jgi:tetratricopeptide (TPR) repeat protein
MNEPRQPETLSRFYDTSPHILLFFVLLFIALIYGNTLYSPPVLDDRATFISNPSVYVDDLSLGSLKQVRSGPFGQTRFIPMLSFAVDQMIGLGSIVQFHLTNIAIHLLATIAIYILVYGLAMTPTGRKHLFSLSPSLFSLFVTALWALHPVQTNAVTYLVQRMTSLAALFYFMSLAGYAWARIGHSGLIRGFGWLVFIMAMACAFLSKENSATLPLAVLLIEGIFITPSLGKRVLARISWRHWLILAIIFMLLLPFLTTKLAQLSEGYAAHGRHFTMPERVFTELRVVVFYISLLALPLPSRLNLDHDFPLSYSLLTPATTWLSLILLVFLILIAFRVSRRHPFIAFGVLFFFLNLIIESSVIPLELVFEHRLYLPSLGFVIIIVSLIDWGGRFIPAPDAKELKAIFLLLITIVCCSLAITTSLRNHVWRDKIVLHKDIVKKSPLKPRAYANLGKELMTIDHYEEALAALQKAISLGRGQSEEYFTAANNIVSIFVSQGKFREAVNHAEDLIRNRPPEKLNYDGFPILMINLAVSYWKLERYDDSLEAFRIGLRTHNPRHTPLLLGGMEAMFLDATTKEEGRLQLNLDGSEGSTYSGIAMALFMDMDYTNAQLYLSKALSIDPDNLKIQNLKKSFDEEVNQNRQARLATNRIEINNAGNSADFRSGLALDLAELIQNRYTLLNTMVGPLLKKAVQLEPDSTKAALKLAHWYLQNGNIEDTLQLVEKHLLKHPELAPLLELAAKCYFKLGENEKAAAELYKLLNVYPGHPNRKRYANFILAYYENAQEPR